MNFVDKIIIGVIVIILLFLAILYANYIYNGHIESSSMSSYSIIESIDATIEPEEEKEVIQFQNCCDLTTITSSSIDILQAEIIKWQQHHQHMIDYIEELQILEDMETTVAALAASQEAVRSLNIISNYQKQIDIIYQDLIENANNTSWDIFDTEYPAATMIWNYMKDLGWNDYVCAGVMGNIMQETGGRSLNINYMHSNNYYGMCCWKKEYHPDVVGLGLKGQCDYLVKTTIACFNNNALSEIPLYQEGYDYEAFLNASSIEEATTAFMVIYERPGHEISQNRIENAYKAYNYFVGCEE